MTMTIANILTAPQPAERRDLYYRTAGKATVQDGAVCLERGAAVSFDTYFNALPYSKYIRYTSIRRVRLSFRARGPLTAVLMCAWPGGTGTLASLETAGDEAQYVLGPVELDELPANGMLYLKATTGEGGAILAARFETDQPPERDVRVAGLICTFHREAYVKRNLAAIESSVWDVGDSPIRDRFDVIVADNGNSLEMQGHSRLRIYPNRNYGGSGGFARGMLEALASERAYTHVLMMDDDISFEPEVLLRTVQLLRYAVRPFCIGGQMLQENAPTVQYEAGGRYINGRFCSVNRGLDLASPEGLLRNGGDAQLDYNAWWYCCIPVDLVREHGLPMPFFIKGDDVEYGLRLGCEFLVMNGIGVWHKAFSEKESPHLEYYVRRNELIVSALHHRWDGAVRSVYKLARAMGKSLLAGDRARLYFLRRAYEDFLKGPRFLMDTDAERLNRELIKSSAAAGTSSAGTVLSAAGTLISVFLRYLVRYRSVQSAYIEKHREMTGECFWREYLGLQEGRE